MRPILYHKLGNFELWFLSDGELWLDGGSMFGIVPRPLWSKLAIPDEQNRVRLGLNPLLIRARNHLVLIETGIDRKADEKFRRIYGLSDTNPLLGQLALLGVEPQDISLVVHTHLHFDHAGLNTRWVEGRLRPTFPKARHIVQKQELEDALHPHERSQASYRLENVEPLLEEGCFEVVEGEAEILPGLQVLPAPGHTLGMQVVELASEGQNLAYTGDLVALSAQAPLLYIPAFDLYPMTSLQTRKRLYERWLEGRYLLCFTHEPGHPLGRLMRTEKGYQAEPVYL
ncbi:MULTISPECIES: MBL fold metallo-hydrolase [Meiothermus]|uniref:MBL fold metallo-hydrolase n=2 Tax=Meiothermus hypogaeus TaxID=884155 RepID=A0A511R732_9DEIN|nr:MULTISPECIES: MBL fold metallo-hydrolase [Meiothermus]RIH74842.1 putative quorum-quenching lactonase YtnP [Meiothermus hypogaeus]GEM84806.1 MBL fold metallo-hydrolase [Meiothermus hypogaeus NBRC 106114]GIW35293.1 MAG: MBL fold metallo-hydrolase [Meiothermus sp.]GIW38142.1 MAG: MBL fold metallo-hydrolase [Meiothermus sp.]